MTMAADRRERLARDVTEIAEHLDHHARQLVQVSAGRARSISLDASRLRALARELGAQPEQAHRSTPAPAAQDHATLAAAIERRMKGKT